ncbi:SET domain protein [Coprinopsis sp. MPI-PUGE-AT-0042]|nr:SET domain protein [Coprinopsis sp. MPI-PUGE-AT-0042]
MPLEVANGYNIVAAQDISPDEEIASCPVELIISPQFAAQAITRALDLNVTSWNARQLICTYIALHSIVDLSQEEAKGLIHKPYLDTLPSTDLLSTPLFFTSEELERFKGTNLYGATQDRYRDWQSEWDQCREAMQQLRADWASQFRWEMYLTAATYISSRAFPSNILSITPSLPKLEDDGSVTDPILLPGVDSLNHARGQPVSWVTHNAPGGQETAKATKISLVVHKTTCTGQEIFNNYGAKPNAELILGYGFSFPDNPDDTIILKLGGIADSKKWVVGRNANGADGLWKEILQTMAGEAVSDPSLDWECILDASGAMQEMVELALSALPRLDEEEVRSSIRLYVSTMLNHYVEGQTSILESLLEYAKEKEQHGISLAREAGIDLQLED